MMVDRSPFHYIPINSLLYRVESPYNHKIVDSSITLWRFFYSDSLCLNHSDFTGIMVKPPLAHTAPTLPETLPKRKGGKFRGGFSAVSP